MNRNGVIIKQENIDKLQKVIDVANGRARGRLVTIDNINDAVDDLQEKFAGVNKGVPMATYLYLLYKNGSWRLLDAKRMPCDTICFRVLKMSDETKNSILRQYETF